MRASPWSRGLLAAGLLAALLLVPGSAHAQRMELARAGAVSGAAAPVDSGLQVAPEAIRGRKSGLVAFGLGYLFPGAGHFYAGESWRGATIMGIVYGGIMYGMSQPEGGGGAEGAMLVSLVTYGWSMIDAPMAARRHNRRLQRAPAASP